MLGHEGQNDDEQKEREVCLIASQKGTWSIQFVGSGDGFGVKVGAGVGKCVGVMLGEAEKGRVGC